MDNLLLSLSFIWFFFFLANNRFVLSFFYDSLLVSRILIIPNQRKKNRRYMVPNALDKSWYMSTSQMKWDFHTNWRKELESSLLKAKLDQKGKKKTSSHFYTQHYIEKPAQSLWSLWVEKLTLVREKKRVKFGKVVLRENRKRRIEYLKH